MRVITGNIWKTRADCYGIPTNGTVSRNGKAVMGKGVALQAKLKFPGIDNYLGRQIRAGGNRLHLIPPNLFSFPVKHNWWEQADKKLIVQSVGDLSALAVRLPNRTFALPLPGTGSGRLRPEEIWPLLQPLPDNVVIVVYDGAQK